MTETSPPHDADYESAANSQTPAQVHAGTSSPAAPSGSAGLRAVGLADVVSGQYDADIEVDAPLLNKRVLAPQAESPKLHKVLAQAGWARDWRWSN